MYGLCGEPTLITPPEVEPITRTQAKRHCKLQEADEDQDIDDWIEAARGLCEEREAIALCTQTWELKLPGFRGPEIWIPKPPLQSVTYLKYYDTANTLQTFSASDYQVMTPRRFPGSIHLGAIASWPATYDRPDAVIVRFVAGYGAAAAVPAEAKHAIKLLVGYYSIYREAVLTGTISKEMDLGVERLLRCVSWSRAGG